MANELKTMLEFIVPRLIQTIIAAQNATEQAAFTLLYSSELYAQLEREETKLWHLSVPMLYDLLCEEQESGTITYPEEA